MVRPVLILGVLAATLPFAAPAAAQKSTGGVVLSGHRDFVIAVAFSPDSTTLASAGYDQTIRLWDIAQRRQSLFVTDASPVFGVAFRPDGKTLATGSEDGAVKLWDVVNGTERAALRGEIFEAFGVAFSPDGRTLAAAGYRDNLYSKSVVALWDVDSRRVLRTMIGDGDFSNVAWGPQAKTVATGWSPTMGGFRVWEVSTGRVVKTVEGGHADHVWQVALSPDGTTLATASRDGTLKLWDAATGKERRSLKEHTASVSSVAFHPRGKVLASGSHDHTVRLWSATTGESIRTLTGHANALRTVAFSPDGRWLASGGNDMEVILWDVSFLMAD
jgi:WD40 repeat protein